MVVLCAPSAIVAPAPGRNTMTVICEALVNVPDVWLLAVATAQTVVSDSVLSPALSTVTQVGTVPPALGIVAGVLLARNAEMMIMSPAACVGIVIEVLATPAGVP